MGENPPVRSYSENKIPRLTEYYSAAVCPELLRGAWVAVDRGRPAGALAAPHLKIFAKLGDSPNIRKNRPPRVTRLLQKGRFCV